VGEVLAEFEAGKTDEVVSRQTRAGLAGLAAEQMANVVIGYDRLCGQLARARRRPALAPMRLVAHAIRGPLGESSARPLLKRTRGAVWRQRHRGEHCRVHGAARP